MSEATDERRALKDLVLEAALSHAAFDGWSRRTLAHAAADAGIDRATAQRLFPQGGDSLLAWLDDWADRRMVEAIAGEDLSRLSIRRRVAMLVRARLELLTPHREAVSKALVARGMPYSVAAAGRSLWRTVDLIWDVVGMPGTAGEGWSWYTRRASLAGLLVATTLYWLEDKSEGLADSWAFLDRRVEDVIRIGKLRARIVDVFRGMPGFRPAAGR
jgi:ubiquinone biosynthesis protein COQ9